ncbi:Rha family transcriptional regulator [Limosilactobacillus fermentum]|uniref:Rha family transcriptional regulator n=1 Tax=Limosilactobacillus fermentum TaxID=1613 RepID=UPI0031CD9AC0
MDTAKIIKAAGNAELAKNFGDLVFLGNVTEEPYTTDEIIAAYSENDIESVKRLAREHKQDFEEFGFFGFEIRKLPGRGRPTKTYKFNEQQATLLITYLGNTSKVRTFKKSLVRAFFAMRNEKLEQIKNRAISIPERRTLTDAIKNWPNCNQWTYKTITDLILKKTTGMNAKQIKSRRNVSNAMDGLTLKEQQTYNAIQSVVIGLLDLKQSYQQIKALLNSMDSSGLSEG